MELKLYNNITVGLVITGSFCTFKKIIAVIQSLKDRGMNVVPVFSENVQSIDNRFNNAKDFIKEIEELTGQKGIYSIPEAEPIGPKALFDVVVIAPCTGNTMAKLANGITDSTALMAAKAHLRNNRPLVIAISTNDALGMNLKNIGQLMNVKNIYFVPFGQDNYNKKPNSMIAHLDRTVDTVILALEGKQLQPVVVSPF
jgi:dipicolinate synthase subunit B